MSGEGESIYRATLVLRNEAAIEIPAVTLMVQERPGGGWTGIAQVDARNADSRTAFAAIMRDGIVPGYSVEAQLKFPVGSKYEDIVVRSWPSIVTLVTSRYWPKHTSVDGTAKNVLLAVCFRDPVSYLRARPIWSAFSQCTPAGILGAVLSQASGGDGKPTRTPAIERFNTTINITENLSEPAQRVAYAIAPGEPLGYWLTRVFGQLGIALGIYGDSQGELNLELSDGEVADCQINEDDGISMSVNPNNDPSGLNMVPAGIVTDASAPIRGTLLDDIEHGGPRRFGDPGPVGHVILSDGIPIEGAERQAESLRGREKLAQVRFTMRSRQPGFAPRRIVTVGLDPNLVFGSPDLQVGQDYFMTLFGANEWQIVDVSHMYSSGAYWNRAGIMKLSAKTTPYLPPSDGAKMVPGIVDDGVSEAGSPVQRDASGRIPILFPFHFKSDEEVDVLEADPWPHRIPLGCAQLVGAGRIHGFVRSHRQGDWCRVAVMNAFYAEVAGFSYRDDRGIAESVEDATMAMALKQDDEQWRGLLFEPSEPKVYEEEEGE